MTPTTLKNSPSPGRWRAKVVEVFGTDLRSLALFRIVLAVLVLADLANRATDLSAHYTDAGVLPRTVLVENVLSPWSFSLNLMNGQPFFQALLFCVAAVAALGMLVGYRTRLVTVVLWVLLLSIQSRNPLISGGDGPLLRLLLFWAMFLPLGAYWSVDRAIKNAAAGPAPRMSARFLSLATVGVSMQIAFMYWFTAALKSGPEWRVDGTALYYALSLDQLSTSFGRYLLNFPDLLTVMTFATFGLEALGPLLLFCPFFTGPVRTGAVMAFMSLHFGIWLTMDIGIFPWISAFCMVCFLPAWFWDVPVAKLRATLPGRFDTAAHRLQHAASHLIHERLLPLQLRLSPVVDPAVPSAVAGPAIMGEDNQLGSRLARIVALPSALISGTPLRNELAAGRGTPNGVPNDTTAGSELRMLRSSLATNLLAFLFLIYVLCWNLSSVSALTMPDRLLPVGPFLGLDQYWGMFAPSPSREDGWFVIPGNLRDGQQTDLTSVAREDYALHEVSWEKPQDVNGIFKNEHWRKYLENIYTEQHAGQRLYLGQYICREWNARHTGPEQLTTFKITYMLEMTQPDYQRSTPKKVVLWEHSCL